MSAQSGHKARTPLLHPQRAVHTLLVQAAAGNVAGAHPRPSGHRRRRLRPRHRRAVHRRRRVGRGGAPQRGRRRAASHSPRTQVCRHLRGLCNTVYYFATLKAQGLAHGLSFCCSCRWHYVATAPRVCCPSGHRAFAVVDGATRGDAKLPTGVERGTIRAAVRRGEGGGRG